MSSLSPPTASLFLFPFTSRCRPSHLSLQILNENPNLFVRTDEGHSTLWFAAKVLVSFLPLLSALSSPFPPSSPLSWYPLPPQIQSQLLPIVERLLARGVDPSLSDPTGQTALHVAVQGRRSDVLRAIMEKGSFRSPPPPRSPSLLSAPLLTSPHLPLLHQLIR